ncbi:hypothetical protein [Haloterrigena salinisoli]|uniref:hypothetical protein n=1 Tax=Haloterrigena salinisoli TaxID=3132747 RepID=UPI0030D3B624
MSKADLDSTANQSIEVGEVYDHASHGNVKVTGIWQGVSSVDTARNTDTKHTIVIRFSPIETDDRRSVPDLADTLNKFLDAIKIDD